MARTATKQRPPEGPPPAVTDKKLSEALSERYLAYALSTIMDRALPDVRDGLKPVHRRLLFAMRELRLNPKEPPKKSARVVGDVIGKFHPHGDIAVYDALVRLAQDFAQRYPLIEGQGNFGNIDGDNPAAMRYTEARLTEVAELLLEGIEENAVDFRATYDGSGQEPAVLPGAFPNLLANGSSGIAVGMATSIPPHNVSELCDALRHLIKFPNSHIDKLVGMVPGPDFPTGGVLAESRESIVEAYKTGKGSFRLRAKWEKEDLKQGLYQVVVTEIPYQVQKSRLIEKIAELLQARKLPLLDDVRDESADDVRLVLIPKSRNVDAVVLMESLFRQTDLETRVPLNLNVLDKDCVPQVMDLRGALQSWLDHRQDVLVRRSKYRLAQIEARLEVLAGYLIAYLNLDKVIKIIRTEDEPKPVLMKTFKLSDAQAEAILNMRLRSLRKLEEMQIKAEQKELAGREAELRKLLKSEDLRWQVIDKELVWLKEKFGKKTPLGARRTEIADAPKDIDVPVESFIERENVTILCSAKGWIRAMRGHIADDAAARAAIKYKEGDGERFALNAETTDKVLLFASNGRFYTLGGDKLPGARGFGEPVRLMIDLPNEAEIVGLVKYAADQQFVVASSDGRGFIVKTEDVLAQTKNGKQVLNVGADARAAAFAPVWGDHLAVIGTNRKLLVFPLKDVPEMGRGRGVILQKYKDGELSDVKCIVLREGLSWKSGERERTETDLRNWLGMRAQTGRIAPNGFARSNKF
ncbi:MAG TPA: DNA topoisomerase IV subunit A [Alphaproteobacteria bacterium]|nr:DNA topoisomerase IV subunit A [Alphaproteobacteria bacterium]